MISKDNPNGQIPAGAHDQYTEGLLRISETKKVDLKTARDIAIKDAEETRGEEHIPSIEASYDYLKSKQP